MVSLTACTHHNTFMHSQVCQACFERVLTTFMFLKVMRPDTTKAAVMACTKTGMLVSFKTSARALYESAK